jgi:Phage terminase, small subunit
MPTSTWPRTIPTRDRISGPAPIPPHFEAEEQALFKQIQTEFAIDDIGSVELLILACEAHARCQAARLQIDEQGMTIKDRFGILQPHPLLKAEASARGQYLAALRALNLEPPQPSKRWVVK